MNQSKRERKKSSVDTARILTCDKKVRRSSIDMEYKHEFKSTICTRIHFSVKRLVEEFHFTMYEDDLCRDYPLELALYFY